jgi:hypothetical protein
MLTRVDPPLYGAMFLLEHVVQIWHRPIPAILGEAAFGFELRDARRIRGVAVGVDYPRQATVRLTFKTPAEPFRNGRDSSPNMASA